MSAPKVSPGDQSGDLIALRRENGMLVCRCQRCGGEYRVRPSRFQNYDCCTRCRKHRIKIGATYGDLRVLSRNADGTYLCQCLRCGRQTIKSSGNVKHHKSCGCAQIDARRINGAKGPSAAVNDGVQLYVATKVSPNKGNRHGHRWVKIIHRHGKPDWYYASFVVGGERYYKGGFSSADRASAWAKAEHDRVLKERGITDPRINEGKSADHEN